MNVKTIQHLNPIWRDKTDFIIGAKCNFKHSGFDEDWEQLWNRKISEFRFEICWIPFFLYDISLGDEVVTGKDFMITKVVKPSGHYTFRVWFGDSKVPNIREIVLDEIIHIGCLFEWYSENLLGIDCRKEDAQKVADLLYEKENKGLFNYETGKTI